MVWSRTESPSLVGMRCDCSKSIVLVLKYVTFDANGLTLCRPGPTARRLPLVTTIPTSPGSTKTLDLAIATVPILIPVRSKMMTIEMHATAQPSGMMLSACFLFVLRQDMFLFFVRRRKLVSFVRGNYSICPRFVDYYYYVLQ